MLDAHRREMDAKQRENEQHTQQLFAEQQSSFQNQQQELQEQLKAQRDTQREQGMYFENDRFLELIKVIQISMPKQNK